MSTSRGLIIGLLLSLIWPVHIQTAHAFPSLLQMTRAESTPRLNRNLAGTVLDFTRNDWHDRRICSQALGAKRDVYIYLPPGYDGKKQYPLMLWLHGVGHDEKSFLEIVHYFDEGIRCGEFPPVVIVVPDGTIVGRPSLVNTGSFYTNSKAGRYEDYIIQDIYPWALRSFAIRPERGAHVLAGASMGGFGAYSLAFKHREEFGVIAGVMPALDLRWQDCQGRYAGNFDPNCIGRRTEFPRFEVVGRFYGIIFVRQRRLLDPLVGRFRPVPVDFITMNNPTDMLDLYKIKPQEFAMFVAYGTEDELNIDAQSQHFVHVASRRGIDVTVEVIHGGRHNVPTGVRTFPALSRFLKPLLQPYLPEAIAPANFQCCPNCLLPCRSGWIRPVYLAPMPTGPSFLIW